MSKQITVRLSDEIVAYLDRLVGEGAAPSRAAVVASAMEREMRRRAAERDAERLGAAADDDLDSLVEWTAGRFVAEE